MTETMFEDAVIPDDIPSEDLTCRICGTPLTYGGRGRKPSFCDEHKRTGATSAKTGVKSTGSVESALTILGGLYDGLAAGLMFASPRAASEWVQRIPTLQTQNRAVLAADPDLCRRINALGKGGGKFAFVAAHAMAIMPVAGILRQDLALRAAEKAGTVQAEAYANAGTFTADPVMGMTPPPRDFFA